MNRIDEAEIVVIGGGVIGCAVAWQLADRERRSVLVVERNDIGGAASSRAAGLITPLRPSAADNWFVAQTLAAFAELTASLGEPVGFRQVGTILIAASPESETRLTAMTAAADSSGTAYEWIDRKEAERRLPWLSAAGACRIAWVPSGGFIDPYLLTQAYARAARAAGARIRSRIAVERIVIDDGRACAVQTDQGRIACRAVVLAAGSWSGPLASQLGLPLGMAPVRSHYWITGPDPAFAADQPVALLPDAASYTRPEQNRLVIGAREARSPSYDARTLPADMGSLSMGSEEERWNGLIERRDALGAFLPRLDALDMVHFIAGLSAYTADGRQIVGPAPGIAGLTVATGCCGMGIATSAGIAKIVADLIAGRPSTVDREPYRPDRFGSFDPYHPDFLEQCALARTAKSGAVSAMQQYAVDRDRHQRSGEGQS